MDARAYRRAPGANRRAARTRRGPADSRMERYRAARRRRHRSQIGQRGAAARMRRARLRQRRFRKRAAGRLLRSARRAAVSSPPSACAIRAPAPTICCRRSLSVMRRARSVRCGVLPHSTRAARWRPYNWNFQWRCGCLAASAPKPSPQSPSRSRDAIWRPPRRQPTAPSARAASRSCAPLRFPRRGPVHACRKRPPDHCASDWSFTIRPRRSARWRVSILARAPPARA